MVSTSARNAGDPWFESRSWYDRFLYVNIHLFIYIYIYIYIQKSQTYYPHLKKAIVLAKYTESNKKLKFFNVHKIYHIFVFTLNITTWYV